MDWGDLRRDLSRALVMHRLFREHIRNLFEQVMSEIPHARKMPSYARSGGHCYVVKGKGRRYLFDLGFVPQRDHFCLHLLWTSSSGRPHSHDEGGLMYTTMHLRRELNGDIPAVLGTLHEGLLQAGDLWPGGNYSQTLATPFVPDDLIERLIQDSHARNTLSVFGITDEISLTQVDWEIAEECGLTIGPAEVDIACGSGIRDLIAHVVIDGFLPLVRNDINAT